MKFLKTLPETHSPCTGDSLYRGGTGGRVVEPVGGDLGESIPKGIDAGLQGALGELPWEVKPRRLVQTTLR